MEITTIRSTPSAAAANEGGQPHTLREATQEFESLLIAQLLKTMRGTVPESGLMGSGSGQQLFREMLDQEFARQIAFAGGFGLGEIVYRQMAGSQPSPPVPRSQGHENR